MKKIKLFVLLTFTSILLCSCSFLNNIINTGSGEKPISTTTTTEPAVTTKTQTTTITSVDENSLKLKLELTGEEELVENTVTYYQIELYQNTTYKINISIDEYEGNDYVITHNISNGENNITISNDLLVTPKKITSSSSSFVQFELKNKKTNKRLDVLYIMFIVRDYEKHDVKLTFEEDTMLFDKRKEYLKWFFNIRPGVDFELKPVVTGIENYEIRYNNTHTNLISINNNVVSVVGTPTSIISFNFYLEIYDQTGHKHLTQSIGCNINGEEEGDDINFKDVFINLEAADEKVVVGEDDYYDFSLTVPYEHVEYALPNVNVEGYEGEYRYEFVDASSFKDFLTLDKKNDVNYFTGHNEYARVRVNVYNTEEKLMDYVVCSIKYTNIGRGEFSLQNQNSKDVIKTNIEADIYEDETFKLVPYFNNHDNLIDDNDFTYQVSNIEAAKIERENNLLVLTTLKAGSVDITFNYSKKDIENTNYDYEVKLKISVKRRTLIEIFANNPNTIAVSGNTAVLNGKMLARYSGDRIIPINSMSGLSYNVADTSDPSVKKVTFTYNDGYTTKEIAYDVDATSSLYQKQALTGNYYDYWDNKRCEGIGDAKILAIPVWFTNSNEFISTTLTDLNNKTQKEQIIEDLNTILFADNQDNNYYSLSSFYNIESRNKLNITGKVSEWFEYNKSSKAVDRSIVSSKMVADAAVEWYFNNHTDETFSDYDLNNDGFIDGLIIYYGAPYLGNPTTNEEARASVRAFFTNSQNNTLKFYGYCYISALDIYNIKGIDSKETISSHADLSSATSKLSSETTIHEFGHALGLKDLYDTVLDGKNYPAGQLTMQDTDDGGHEPYSTLALGWNSVYIFDASDTTLANSITFTFNDFQTSGDVILLTPHMNSANSVFDEYILIELYTPTLLNVDAANKWKGYGVSVPTGIKVWHINAKLGDDNYHLYSNDAAEGAEDNNVFNLVHLIRNNETAKYGLDAGMYNSTTAFLEGDEFSVDKFNTQFINDGVLDSEVALGWTFTIDAINEYADGSASATITLTKSA